MYFKRLEMHGFKSFAEPVVIDFNEGITCIVGPNGSGKSNISDAIRWVLGEQSPKALRGGKMDEVIFAGTEDRKSRGMAEVTLVIDNTEGVLDIAYNEVAITRRMFRTGESEYLINNNQCRLKDIRELIMDTGIGVDGYSIIGQGKIADIVSSKPENRREIFEESAGIVMYKNRKAEAERKLESTQGNLDRVEDILAEIEGRIGGLKEESEKAAEYLKLKERYTDLEINISLYTIDNIEAKNKEIKSDLAGMEDKLRELRDRKASVDAEIAEARERSENLDKLGNEARENQLKLIEEINTLRNKSQVDEERLRNIENDDKRLADEITEIEGKISKEKNNETELIRNEREISASSRDADENLQKKVISYNELSANAAALASKIEAGKDAVYRFNSTASSKESEARSIQSLKDTLLKRKTQLSEEAGKIAAENVDAGSRLHVAELKEKEVRRKLVEISDYLANSAKDRVEMEESLKRLNLTIEDNKIKGSQLDSRMHTIEEMESNYEGYNYAVKYIMRSSLVGIRGVVAEMMHVPEGMEIAIETALGASMQNIVVDTDDDAKRAVNALKDSNSGRLTFLPVASVRGGRADVDSRIIGDPGYKGLGCDCIRFEDKYRNIFHYLLGRVAVVEDMDTAVRLSKLTTQGLRFVTLDGEVINSSGAITGGRYKNKTANLLERKAEITKLGRELDEIRKTVLSSVQEAKRLAQNIEELKSAQASKEADQHAEEITLAEITTAITSIEAELKGIGTDSSKSEREMESIEKELVDADGMISELLSTAEKAKIDAEEAGRSIENDMISYENAKKLAESASEEITSTRVAAGEWAARKESIENLLKRVRSAISDYEFQMETKQNQQRDLAAEKNRIVFGSGSETSNIENLMIDKSKIDEYIKGVQEERAGVGTRLNTITREKDSVDTDLNSYAEQKYQLEIKSAKNDTQLDTLKDRLWNDFEISYAQAMDYRRGDFVLTPSVKESREIRNRMKELGDVNVGSIKEYESVSERYKFLNDQKADITTAMEELNSIITEMDGTIRKQFKENFDQVVLNFEEIFKDLFSGGTAELRLEDEENPLESGIIINAQPPGKKLRNINLLSGGEKTMTAIALMFAVLKTKPTPFCIMDEVEAALDDNNIDMFAEYLRKFDGIQFALITHQKETMEHADVLYGVTMPERGVSKVLSLKLGDADNAKYVEKGSQPHKN